MIALRWGIALVLCAPVSGQPFRQTASRQVDSPLRGAGHAAPGEIWTWGEQLTRWRGPDLRGETLGSFSTGHGGCLYDVDADGKLDVVAPVVEGLASFRSPSWHRELLDEGPDFEDCLGVELFGRRGIVALFRGMQVRFYQRSGGRWHYRELYSFYTASRQGGLLARDIDGDGRQDLVAGNYWLQSPEEFDLPWRLFAINTWSETPEAASARLAFRGMSLVWAEARSSPARLAIFSRPLNPKLLWGPVQVETVPPLAYPGGLAVFEDRFILAGERNGPKSRLLVVREDGSARTLDRGWPILSIIAGEDGFWAVGEDRLSHYAATGSQRPPARK